MIGRWISASAKRQEAISADQDALGHQPRNRGGLRVLGNRPPHNGLGRYEEAQTAACQASEDITALHITMWALPELIEAGVRAGQAELAQDALKQLAEMKQPCGNDSALGMEARCRALLSHDADADRLYREAIDRLGRIQLRPELARAHLLYGEWLRREGRRVHAREQLRTAHGMLTAIGMTAFAERARRELSATGEEVRKRNVETLWPWCPNTPTLMHASGPGSVPVACPIGRQTAAIHGHSRTTKHII